jgi:hypothetical protein
MLSPQTSQRLLYASAGLSAFTVYKHISICVNEFFPILNSRLGADDPVVVTAKSQMLQISAAVTTMGMFQFQTLLFKLNRSSKVRTCLPAVD